MVRAFEDIIAEKPQVRSFEELTGESQAAPAPEPEPDQFDDILGPFEERRQRVNSFLRGDESIGSEMSRALIMPRSGGYYGLDDSELGPLYERMIDEYEDRMVNSLGLAHQLNADPETAKFIFDNHDMIIEENFGEKGLSPAIARKYLAEQTDLNNKKRPATKEPWYDDLKTIYKALKEGSPYGDETEPGYYDAFKWLVTYTASLGGRIGGKGLREELLDAAKEYKGFGEAVGTGTGDALVTYFEWAVLYPKLFKAVGIGGKAIEKLPAAQKAKKAVKGIPWIDEFITKNPKVTALATRAVAAFTKGEIVGQTTAAAELAGKDEPIGEWVSKMNKRGAMLGGVSLVFSAAHSYDQYRYIKNTKRYLYQTAYNRHAKRMKGGMSEKASRSIAEREGEKIKDIIYYMESEFYGETTELYGGKKPALSPEQAARDFALHGYDIQHGGKTYKELSKIRRGRLRDVLLNPEPKPKAAQIQDRPTSYQEIIQISTGKRVGIAPPGTTVKQLMPGFGLSEPIPFNETGVHITEVSKAEKPAKAVSPAEQAKRVKDMMIPYSEARARMAAEAEQAEEGPEKTKLQKQLDEMDAQAAQHLASIAQEGLKETEPTITPPKGQAEGKKIVAPPEGVPKVTAEGIEKRITNLEAIKSLGKRANTIDLKVAEALDKGEDALSAVKEYYQETYDKKTAKKLIKNAEKETKDIINFINRRKEILKTVKSTQDAPLWSINKKGFRALLSEEVKTKYDETWDDDIKRGFRLGESSKRFGPINFNDINFQAVDKNGRQMPLLAAMGIEGLDFTDIESEKRFTGHLEIIRYVKNTLESRGYVLLDSHEEHVKQAVKEGRPVPREVLEEYKSEKWAQEALEKSSIEDRKSEISSLREQLEAREAGETDEQLSGITKKRRRSLVKETAEKIKAHDIYQSAVEALDVRERQIGPGFYYIHESGRGEVEAIIPPKRAKDFKKRSEWLRYKKLMDMFTFDRGDLKSGAAEGWDVAVQQGLVTETEQGEYDTHGEMDISEFVQRVVDAYEAGVEVDGLNLAALETFATSGYPEAEMLAEKYRMLQRGSSDIEINEMITEWAERNDIPIEAVMDEFINADKMLKIAEMSEAEQEAEIERLATEQILAEDQIAAQQSAIDVLEANDIQAEVRTVEEIDYTDKIPFERGRGRPTGAAMTVGQREVILLALGADIETGAHEGWHLLRNRLTNEDQATLMDKYGPGLKGEEAEAAAFGRFYKENKAPISAIRKIFEKIKRLLAKIKSALAGKGFRTVEDIFGEAVAGTIAKKSPAAPERGVMYETKGERLEAERRRAAELKARIQVRKERIKAQAELMPAKKKKPKKVSRARLKINIRETTPPLRPDLATVPKGEEIPGQAYVYPEPKPGDVKKAKVLLDDSFLDAQAEKMSMTMAERFGPGAARTALGTSRALIAMSQRLERIDPTLKYATRRYVFDAQERAIKLSDDALPMVEAWRSFSKEDKRRFQFAAWNGMTEQVYEIAEKYNAIDQLEKFREVMDDIRTFGNELGMEINYTKQYWPRAVKDFDGLIDYLETTEFWSPIEQALIARKEQASGRELTQDEQMQVISTLMRGFRVGGVSLSRPGPARERTIDVLDKYIEKYYHKFDAGIGIYIQDMMQAAGAREFFGKTTKEIQALKAQKSRLATSLYKTSTRIGYKKAVTVEKHEEHISKRREKFEKVTAELEKKKLHTLDDSISAKILEMHTAHRISTAQQKEIAGMFKAIFEPKGVHGFWRNFVKLSYLDTLANTEVAITQLEEMGLSFYTSKTKAIPALARAFTGRSKISMKEMTITDINQYIQDLGFDTIGNKLLIALRMADKPGKEALGNIVIDMARELAAKPDAMFKMSMKQMFGKNAGQVIEDLKSGKVTSDIRFIGFNGIADHQPIAITETSEYFARAGNWRVLYMLRQFTLRRLSVLHGKMRKMMVNPAKNPTQFITGAIDLMQYLAILTAFGVGKDVVRSYFDGDPFDEDDLWDSVVDNLLQFLLLSKWTARKMKQEGIGPAIGAELMPPTKGIDAVIKDIQRGEINKTMRSVPYIGERYYQWYGGGSESPGSWGGIK